MPKITGGITAAIVAAALALGGIGVGTAIAQNGTPEPEATIAAETTTPPSAETPAPEISEDAAPGPVELSEEDLIFLAYVEEQTPDWTPTVLPDMSDADLIAAGHLACEQIAAGVSPGTLRLAPGEEPSPMGDYVDSSAIFNGGITAYCRDLVEWPEG